MDVPNPCPSLIGIRDDSSELIMSYNVAKDVLLYSAVPVADTRGTAGAGSPSSKLLQNLLKF